MTSPGLVGLECNGPVAIVTLNRPERHNSLVPELLEALRDELVAIGADDAVRAVVLAAAGRSFSTGGDVRGFFESGDDRVRYASNTVGLLNEVILTMLRLRQPIVAAVHGMVTGGSLGLVLASDVVVIAPEATITPWYGLVGFSPDGGWTALLPDRIGKSRVAALLLRNGSVSASDALAWGLADEIVDGAMVCKRAEAVAGEIAALQPGAIAGAKRLLNHEIEAVAARLETEREAFVAQIQTPEAVAGMAAFLRRE